MPIVETLKNFYYSMEDQYYAVLDKINNYIPIYKIIDPIDKVFPSFILFLILAVLLILFLVFSFTGAADFLPAPLDDIVKGIIKFIWTLGGILPSTLTAIILVQDTDKAPIIGASVDIVFGDKDFSGETSDAGEYTVEIPEAETDATLTVAKTDYKSQTDIPVTLKAGETIKVTLQDDIAPPLVDKEYDIEIIDGETNNPITREVTATFHCSGSGNPPADISTTTGEIENVKPGTSCGRLTADFRADGYTPKLGQSITNTTSANKVRMYKKKGKVKVTVTDPAGSVESVQLKLKKDDTYISGEGLTTASGDWMFDAVEPGNYTVSATAPDGRNDTSDAFDVVADQTTDVPIVLGPGIDPDLQKKIFIKVIGKTESSPDATENIAHAKVTVTTNGIVFESEFTADNGTYSREADHTKSYDLVIEKENYVTRIQNDIPLKDNEDTEPFSLELMLLTDNPANYGEILIHVADEIGLPIELADVVVTHKETGGIIGYPGFETDSDGNVFVTALPEGTYTIKAESGSKKGEEETTVVTGKVSMVVIEMIFGEGTVQATVEDIESGDPIAGSIVVFKDPYTGSEIADCVGLTDTSGQCESPTLDAGTAIQAHATAAGYYTGSSLVADIVSGSMQEVSVLLSARSPNPCEDDPLEEVCGADGTPYPNECYARLAGVQIDCAGSCPCPASTCTDNTGCIEHSCPTNCSPVCDADSGDCYCYCPHRCEDDPIVEVCGRKADGTTNTYDNPCFALEDGAFVCGLAPCPCDGPTSCTNDVQCEVMSCPTGTFPMCSDGQCICYYDPRCSDELEDPVCGYIGNNWKEYYNPCYAEKDGATVRCSGSCPCIVLCTGDDQCIANECPDGSEPKCVDGKCECVDIPSCSDYPDNEVCGYKAGDCQEYTNWCYADDAEVAFYCMGQCPCPGYCTDDSECTNCKPEDTPECANGPCTGKCICNTPYECTVDLDCAGKCTDPPEGTHYREECDNGFCDCVEICLDDADCDIKLAGMCDEDLGFEPICDNSTCRCDGPNDVPCSNDPTCDVFGDYYCPVGCEGICGTLGICDCESLPCGECTNPDFDGVLDLGFIRWCPGDTPECDEPGVNPLQSLAEPVEYWAVFNVIAGTDNINYEDITQQIHVGDKDEATLPTDWKMSIVNEISHTGDPDAAVEFFTCMDPTNWFAEPECASDLPPYKKANITWPMLDGGSSVTVRVKTQVQSNLAEGTPIRISSKAKAKISTDEIACGEKNIKSNEEEQLPRINQISCADTDFAWNFSIDGPSGNTPISPNQEAIHKLSEGTEYSLNYAVQNCSIFNTKYSVELTLANPEENIRIDPNGQNTYGPFTAFDNASFNKGSTETGAITLKPEAQASSTTIELMLNPNPLAIDSSDTQTLEFEVVGELILEVGGYPSHLMRYDSGCPNCLGQIFQGYVKDSTGTPVRNALVKLKNGTEDIAGGTAYSDNEGNFYMSVIENFETNKISKVDLVVSAAGYADLGPIEIDVWEKSPDGPISQKYRCITINNEIAVEATTLARLEKILDPIQMDGIPPYSIVTIATNGPDRASPDERVEPCPHPVEIRVTPDRSGKESAVFKLEGNAGTEDEQTVEIQPDNAVGKKLIIGATNGIQGEFPVLIEARFLSGDETEGVFKEIAVVYASFYKRNNCVSMVGDKFRYLGENYTGAIKSACAVPNVLSTGYPKAIIDEGIQEFQLQIGPEGILEYDWTLTMDNFYKTGDQDIAVTIEGKGKFATSGPAMQTADGSNDLIEPGLNLYINDTDDPIIYTVTTGTEKDGDKVIAFVDGADNTIKAVLNPNTIDTARAGFTLDPSKLAEYATIEYTGLADPSPGALGGTTDFQTISVPAIKISGYKISGNSITPDGSTITIPAQELPADGQIHDAGNLSGLTPDSDFFIFSGGTDDKASEVLFKSEDGIYSNIAFTTDSTVSVRTANYTGVKKNIDLVFVVDASTSGRKEWDDLYSWRKQTITALETMGFIVTTKIYPLGKNITKCMNLDKYDSECKCPQGVTECEGAYGTIVEGEEGEIEWDPAFGDSLHLRNNIEGCPSEDDKCDSGCPTCGYQDDLHEAWGPGVIYVLNNNEWTEDAKKVVVVIGDSDPTGKRCAYYNENFESNPDGENRCNPQWRSESIDAENAIMNTFNDRIDALLEDEEDIGLFFYYGFPIQSSPIGNEYTKYVGEGSRQGLGDPKLNDVFEFYQEAVRADLDNPLGEAQSFGGDTDATRLIQMILQSMLPKTTQKFQVRTDADGSADCSLGSGLNGFTGQNADSIPKVKFSWSWEGPDEIGIKECDYSPDGDFIYCDQAQFYISLVKKLHRIKEWSVDKPNDELDEINSYLNFTVALIEDTYTDKFREDFGEYFSGNVLFNVPTWFAEDPDAQPWDEYLADPNFQIKMGDNDPKASTEIAAGTYDVTLFLDPANPYEFFDGGVPNVNITVKLNPHSTPNEFDNPFYHMPINAGVGIKIDGSAPNRENIYGTKFTLDKDIWFGENLSMGDISAGNLTVPVEKLESFGELNQSDKVGRVLIVPFNPTTYQPSAIDFLPSIATPVVIEAKTQSQMAVFDYFLKETSAPSQIVIPGEDYLSHWRVLSSEAGKCIDFAGNVWRAWEGTGEDYRDLDIEKLPGLPETCTDETHDKTFGNFWGGLTYQDGKSVYFETVLFTPEDTPILLKKACDNSVDGFNSTIYSLNQNGGITSLGSTAGALDINPNTTKDFIISKLGQVFENVKNENLCVALDIKNRELVFFWNPNKVSESLRKELVQIDPKDFCD